MISIRRRAGKIVFSVDRVFLMKRIVEYLRLLPAIARADDVILLGVSPRALSPRIVDRVHIAENAEDCREIVQDIVRRDLASELENHPLVAPEFKLENGMLDKDDAPRAFRAAEIVARSGRSLTLREIRLKLRCSLIDAKSAMMYLRYVGFAKSDSVSDGYGQVEVWSLTDHGDATMDQVISLDLTQLVSGKVFQRFSVEARQHLESTLSGVTFVAAGAVKAHLRSRDFEDQTESAIL
ncbi:MAG: hypothetical protein RIF32_15580 [Leptospirales bacterium]|jgi:hypothetical protein